MKTKTTSRRGLVFIGLLIACLLASTAQAYASSLVPLYRLWNPHTTDHFYTTSGVEAYYAKRYGGYIGEGFIGYVAAHYSSYPQQPLYRLWNPRDGDHFYTTSAAERDNARRSGWTYEGIQCYVWGGWFSYPFATPIQVWRLYNPTIRDHFYTENYGEVINATYGGGYFLEGGGPYFWTSATTPPL